MLQFHARQHLLRAHSGRCCLSSRVSTALFSSSSSSDNPDASSPQQRPKLSDRLGLVSDAKRVTVKLGSQVVTRSNGSGIAFGRLFNVVEQLAQLKASGREVILVSSGAVAAGRHRLRHLSPPGDNSASLLPIPSRPLPDILVPSRDVITSNINAAGSGSLTNDGVVGPSMMSCSASGQSGLMAIYEWMFSQYNIDCAQVLISQTDLANEAARHNVLTLVKDLLKGGLLPIINENDAIPRAPSEFQPGASLAGNVNLADNDGIASLVASASDSDLLLLMSNVDGVYTADPNSDPSATRVRTMNASSSASEYDFTGTSKAGRGGMGSKVDAAAFAQENGVSCIVASGMVDPNVGLYRSILDAVEGYDVGTFFPANGGVQSAAGDANNANNAQNTTEANEQEVEQGTAGEALAILAREGGNSLRRLSADDRSLIIENLAALLEEEEFAILAANERDLEAAKKLGNLSESLFSRLKLSSEKLNVLASGLRQIGQQSKGVLGEVVSSTEIAVSADGSNSNDLVLVKETVPIGNLLVIFESRPDVLPQVAALAIATGNGLVLKGGSEAAHSNRVLHGIVQRALASVGGPSQVGDACQLIETRADVAGLLGLDHVIDLVIPRGGNELVQSIQRSTRIPVLGHADGICHAFVDSKAEPAVALDVLRDAKCDYPAACNAVETILLHRSLLEKDESGAWQRALQQRIEGDQSTAGQTVSAAQAVVQYLQHNGVTLRSGPKLQEILVGEPNLLGASLSAAESMRVEYGTLECAIDIVDDVDEAIAHIRQNGSGHTEVVLTQDDSTADTFLNGCDSACLFHNVSSRFADGYRFGLGAEVGISTSRIHARGPVGMEGLLSTTFKLRGSGHTVAGMAEGKHVYTHRAL